MQDVWLRIEAWLAAHASDVRASLGAGATEQAIAETENELGATFPDEVRASYRLHDGQPWSDPRSGPPGFLYGWDFLSLDRIRDEWRVWKDLLDGGDFEDTLPDR